MAERCNDREHYLCPGYPICDGGIILQEDISEVQPEVREKILVQVNLFNEDIEALKKIAEAGGTTMTEALRGAIATEKFLADQAEKENEFYLREKDSPVMRKVLWRRYFKVDLEPVKQTQPCEANVEIGFE